MEIRPCFGLEHESAMSLLDTRSRRLHSSLILQKFISLAAERYAHLPARDSSGIFLANGGRLYVDCSKPELTTPEVNNPTDACRYSRAGEAILWDVGCALVERVERAASIMMTRSNISYGGRASTWACHESYGHRGRVLEPADFLPHAVSRIVYSGAGGFDNCSCGVQFLISPRVTHLRHASSDNTQRDRGIFNTKDEPLCRGGYHRLHVICGEQTSSIRAQWLKMATTATVVAMVEAGMSPGEGLQLADPVRAMRDFAEDVTLTAAARLTSGRHITALELQRQLLTRARQLDVHGPINDWLGDCLRLWEETLDRLQEGPAAVQRSLDWAIKLDLFRRHVQQRGLSWNELCAWNDVMARLTPAGEVQEECFRQLTTSELGVALRAARREVDPTNSVDWEQLDLVLQVRQQLFEIDTRFGEYGPRGIFNVLDAQGLLDHQVPGVDDIPLAMTEPPTSGRAQLRGRVIKRMAAAGTSGACEWSYLWDYQSGQVLDLSDPFAVEEQWKAVQEVSDGEPQHSLSMARAVRQGVLLYDRGEYEMADRMIRMAARWTHLVGSRAGLEGCRFCAWIQARRGFTDGARWLETLYPQGPRTLSEVCDYLLVFRFQGLVPGRLFHQWTSRGAERLEAEASAEPCDIVTLRACQALVRLAEGFPQQAWDAYHVGVQPDWLQQLHTRTQARILAEQAEVLRHLRRFDAALGLLDHARAMQTEGYYHGDRVDLTLATRAKVLLQMQRRDEALDCLRQALAVQRDTGNVVGEVRTLVLAARLGQRDGAEWPTLAEMRERINGVVSQRPALAECQVLGSILQRWDDWAGGQNLPDQVEWFAGV